MKKHAGKISIAALLLCITFAAAQSAFACTPPVHILPFPTKQTSEADDDFAKRVYLYHNQEREAQAKQQLAYSKGFEARLWEEAKSIILYRIASRRSVQQTHLPAFGPITYTRLMPVKTIRGGQMSAPLQLKSEVADTSCGPMRLGDHPEGLIGDPVIVFSFAAPLQTDNIARIITPKDALDERTIAVFRDIQRVKR